MSDPFEIKIEGADKIVAGLTKFPEEITTNFKRAGEEAATEIIMTEGLKVYPPKTAANAPPTPYYIRGTGTQYKSRNAGNSEDYKNQFYAKPINGGTMIGNRASYAKYLAGEEQARAMAKIGWRKLYDVAKEKLTQITTIFNKWAQYTIDKLGL
jgi:hypothetical protein